MLWACSWQILIVQDPLGWKRSLRWARSLIFPALHQSRRDFISLNWPLLGISLRSTQIILLLAALGCLFSPHNCFQGSTVEAMPSALWLNSITRQGGPGAHLSHVSHSHWFAHASSCVHVHAGDSPECERQTDETRMVCRVRRW